jgi:hypothetical protein
MPRIIAVIGPTGDVTITTEGYSGTQCQEATKSLEAALGKVTKDQATPEMYQEAKEVQKQWQ